MVMKFILQDNLINEDHLLQMKYAMEPYPHTCVGVIPFSKEISHQDGELTGTDYIPYGSTLFTMLTYDLGWKGLYFDLDRFNYTSFLENRDDMLNSNVMEITEAIEFLSGLPKDSDWFVRPSEDLKLFTGMVDTAENIVDWFKDAMECESSGSYKIEKGTDVVVSDPRNIQAEWRYFIVDGKIVSGSMYRYEGRLYKQRVTEQDILDEAQTFADKWLPHQNVVMDLALVDDKLKVIEFNCINSSGFYDNDIESVITALWEYENK
jgi:hypothetical protein